jgi:hypothetical protein
MLNNSQRRSLPTPHTRGAPVGRTSAGGHARRRDLDGHHYPPRASDPAHRVHRAEPGRHQGQVLRPGRARVVHKAPASSSGLGPIAPNDPRCRPPGSALEHPQSGLGRDLAGVTDGELENTINRQRAGADEHDARPERGGRSFAEQGGSNVHADQLPDSHQGGEAGVGLPAFPREKTSHPPAWSSIRRDPSFPWSRSAAK